MLAAQMEAARAAEKAHRKLELDLAAYRGSELYRNTAPDSDGFRRVSQRAARGSLEELRAVAQNFTAQPKAYSRPRWRSRRRCFSRCRMIPESTPGKR